MFDAGNKYRGRVRFSGHGRGAGLREVAAALHAEGRRQLQLSRSRRLDRHRPRRHRLLLGTTRTAGRPKRTRPCSKSWSPTTIRAIRRPDGARTGTTSRAGAFRRRTTSTSTKSRRRSLTTRPSGMAGRYCHSLMPNVSPVYKDVLNNPKLHDPSLLRDEEAHHHELLREFPAQLHSTGNELLQGVNPLAGIVHGRSILAQTVQKVVSTTGSRRTRRSGAPRSWSRSARTTCGCSEASPDRSGPSAAAATAVAASRSAARRFPDVRQH